MRLINIKIKHRKEKRYIFFLFVGQGRCAHCAIWVRRVSWDKAISCDYRAHRASRQRSRRTATKQMPLRSIISWISLLVTKVRVAPESDSEPLLHAAGKKVWLNAGMLKLHCHLSFSVNFTTFYKYTFYKYIP